MAACPALGVGRVREAVQPIARSAGAAPRLTTPPYILEGRGTFRFLFSLPGRMTSRTFFRSPGNFQADRDRSPAEFARIAAEFLALCERRDSPRNHPSHGTFQGVTQPGLDPSPARQHLLVQPATQRPGNPAALPRRHHPPLIGRSTRRHPKIEKISTSTTPRTPHPGASTTSPPQRLAK